MFMKLFYGADKLVIEPKFGLGNPKNDYGLGFYLTPDYPLAVLWASKNKENGYAITYSLNMKNLKVLYLNNNSEEDVLKWITILVNHRFSKDEYEENRQYINWLRDHFYPNLSEYDVIVGYRADDAYFSYAKDFVSNNLSLELLSEAMKLGKLGLQYVLISKKAFSNIKYFSHKIIPPSKEYEIFRETTLNEYRRIKKEESINNTFIRDIMRKYNK